jgi:hypothetical protein
MNNRILIGCATNTCAEISALLVGIYDEMCGKVTSTYVKDYSCLVTQPLSVLKNIRRISYSYESSHVQRVSLSHVFEIGLILRIVNMLL